MPELKRIKREEDRAETMEPGEVPGSPSSPAPSAPSPGSHGSDDPTVNHADKVKVRVNVSHFQSSCYYMLFKDTFSKVCGKS